jgi:hypothetical protein
VNQTYKQYEQACKVVVAAFVDKYYGGGADVHFIGDECDGVVNVNDEFYDVSFMAECLRLGINKNKMFEYHDMAMNSYQEGKTFVRLRHWMKME